MRVGISSEALAAIRAHAAADPEHEVCGLLFGSADHIDGATATRNVADDPTRRFEVETAALIAAHRVQRAGGPTMIGCYHSHPNGRAEPSPTDWESAAKGGELWLITSGEQVSCWRAGAKQFEPVDLVAIQDTPHRLG